MTAPAAGFSTVFEVVDGVVIVHTPSLLDPIRSTVHREGRPCVHLDTHRPPVLLLLDWDAVAALNFQSRLVETPAPVHASRVADRLTIGVDTLSGRCCTSRRKDRARPTPATHLDLPPVASAMGRRRTPMHGEEGIAAEFLWPCDTAKRIYPTEEL